MVIEAILFSVWYLLDFILNLLPSIPQMPSAITSSIDSVFNLIFSNVGLLGVFVPLNIVKILIPLWLVVDNFDKIYSILFWIVKKIPTLNIRE